MDMSNVTEIVKRGRTWAQKHSSEILAGIGVAGMLSTTVLAVKATPRALTLIEERKKEEGVDALDAGETVKTVWKCYIPAFSTGVLSLLCLVGASATSARRNAALATAYTISESALREYKNKVIETIGEKKEQKVRDAIAKDTLERDPVSNKEVFVTEKGNTLCYDVLSGRYFKSDIETIKKAVNELNHRMFTSTYISLNEFYYAIGLSATKLGNELGWRIEQGVIELDFSAQLADDGTPCIVIDYMDAPKYNFDKWL